MVNGLWVLGPFLRRGNGWKVDTFFQLLGKKLSKRAPQFVGEELVFGTQAILSELLTEGDAGNAEP